MPHATIHLGISLTLFRALLRHPIFGHGADLGEPLGRKSLPPLEAIFLK